MSTRRWRRLLVEPARPDAIRSRPGAPWLAVATVCIGAFMGQLDASIVTLAFPTLSRDFDASLGQVQWVGLTYLLVLVGLVTAVGRLADMVGRKLLYTYGFLVFIAGSALCGIAPGLVLLDVFRVVQAVGAAMLQANSVAIIASAVPREKLGRAIGVQGAAQALGLSLGPAVGGGLIALAGWRLIFFINVPAGLVGMAMGRFLIPRSRDLAERAPFDWPGLALFLPATVLLLLALSFGNEVGWGSTATVCELVGAGASGAAFARHERRRAHPMIDPGLLRRPAFSAGIASGLGSYLVMFGTLFVVPFFLENARHVAAGTTGAELTVMPAALGLVAPAAGRLADRVGPRLLTGAGMALSAGALTAMALSHHATAVLLVELAVLGVGLGAFTPANNAAIMAAAPAHQSGMAAGVLNMTRGLGTALGLAGTGAVLGAVAGTRAGQAGGSSHGFTVACLFLAGVAAVAGLIQVAEARSDGSSPPHRGASGRATPG